MIIENGITRHAMKPEKLERLYKLLEDFQADLTLAEWDEYRETVKQVQTILHQRMNQERAGQ